MGEVGGIVAPGVDVMEVMVGGPTIQPKGHQAVKGPWQLIAAVILH